MPQGKPLTELSIKAATPRQNVYKLYDGGGMYLLVHPNGSRYWRLKYRYLGKEKSPLAFGVYPDVSLKDARQKREEAKRLLREGKDPSQIKKDMKRQAILQSTNTFEAMAKEWHENQKERWTKDHAQRVIHSLEKDIFPHIGDRAISHIDTPELIEVLKKVEKRDALDVAKRLKQRCASVFSYAKQTGRLAANPATDLNGVLKTRKQTHRLALTKAELPEFLQKLEVYDGHIMTRLAVNFLILTFVRSTELREAEWSEFNIKEREWRIPAERMKMREPHIVPLSRQAITILEKVKNHTGNGKYAFSIHSGQKPLSENTMIYAIYRMGYHKRATIHGFRATASTILNEIGDFLPDIIERQLAHKEGNEVRAAYNRANYLPQRKKMMQWWADYLDALRKDKAKSPAADKTVNKKSAAAKTKQPELKAVKNKKSSKAKYSEPRRYVIM